MPSEAINMTRLAGELLGMPGRTSVMRTTFSSWRLNADGTEGERRDLAATTLKEAIAEVTPRPMKAALAKGGFPSFVILETDDSAREGTARQRLHFYTMKCKRGWRAIGNFGEVVATGEPYAVHAGSLAMNAFEPRRPFNAAVDCPGNGRQPGEARMIEAGR